MNVWNEAKDEEMKERKQLRKKKCEIKLDVFK
jgi:hypothetical protein